MLAAPLRFVAPSAVNPHENSYKPHMLRSNCSLTTVLSLTAKAHPKEAQFKLNRAFKVILIGLGRNPKKLLGLLM